MADSALSGDLMERYGAIEKAYCDERWQSVIQDGQTLLNALGGSTQAPDGLQERLQLLMAHAHLYGFGDRDVAEDLYQAVLRSGAEASLRQIAEQGLAECSQPRSVAPAREPESMPEPHLPHSGSPQAAPAPAPAEASPELSAALSWLQQDTPEPAAEPQALSDQPVVPATPSPPDPSPVMPWLANPPLAEPATPTSPAATDPDQWLAAPPFVAASEQPALDMPPPPQAASLEVPALLEPTPNSPSAPELRGDSGGSLPVAGWEQPLVPEVVEEPELIEVHQSDPRLAEELELPVRESLPPAAVPITQAEVPAASSLESLDQEPPVPAVVTIAMEDPPLEAFSGEFTSVSVAQVPERQTASAAPPALILGAGPFYGPPEPVAEEDPELLAGLLRVEMG